jgi:RNA polymerase sigma factor (sigma-70 family)
MVMSSSDTAAQAASDAWFVTTQWSVVLSTRNADPVQSSAALETLCQTYWYPLYAYVRRKGHNPHDAQDLTQEFFARMLQKDQLVAVAREKGKFRTFLLVALNRFLINDWNRSQTQKRGGGCVHVPFQVDDAETRYLAEPADRLTAEKLYERRWALTLLERVLERLRQEFARDGKAALFEQLKGSLMAEKGEIPNRETAAILGMNEGAVKVAIYRLRRRFRKLFHEEVANTVEDQKDVEEEIRHLFESFSD